MSLINREALLEAYDTEHKGPPGRARELIADAPEVDAIEVIRCKDCKWRNGTMCPMYDWWTPEGIDEFFCRFGERRTE